MINPDGVIIGNYRSSISGHDLNRQYLQPDPRMHPNLCAFKKLISSIYSKSTYSKSGKFRNIIGGFFDFHAHSRKKGIFIYAPHFPLHSDKYLKVRIFPKLLSEMTSMFRYYSCRFLNE